MHKQEASILFRVLGNETAVKAMKMLYNRGKMDFDTLAKVVGADEEEFNLALHNLTNNSLVIINDGIFEVNKALLDELLSFIVTPCGCTHK